MPMCPNSKMFYEFRVSFGSEDEPNLRTYRRDRDSDGVVAIMMEKRHSSAELSSDSKGTKVNTL